METIDKMKNEREIAESYLSSLVDLTNNSKPLINMLTMLAEENIEHGQIIVDAVEQRIAKVESELKLPILYLIDSIVKNVGGVYIKYFSQSIVKIFIGAFEKVNEDIRKKMFALRQTWNEVFPASKLYSLDVNVNQIDPHWPIVAQKIAPPIHQKISPAIHVNPNFFTTTSEKHIQTELQIKQRELLELKKRKLELELAATQKQLSTVAVAQPTQPPTSHPVIVDPSQLLATQEPQIPNVVMPVIPKPVTTIPPPNFMPPAQMPVSNVRTRIAPVNPTLVNSVRLRDPRLARQTPQNMPKTHAMSHTIQPMNEHMPPKLSTLGPIPRISNANFTPNHNRIPRIQPIDSMPYNDTTNKPHVNNSNNSIDLESKDNHKHKNSRSPTKPLSKSSSGKSGSGSGSKSSSKSSSSSKGSSSKSERSSSRSTSSSSSSTKKSKTSRKDDKSPQRKKSSSRHRSPTTSRRSSSPADAQKTSSSSSLSRKSSYDNKSKSSDSKHGKEKNSDSHSSSSSKSSPSRKSSRNRSSRSKSPSIATASAAGMVVVMKATDPITKDIDLRAQLQPPISLTNSLINSTIIDNDLIVSTVPLASSVSIADRNTNINSDIRDQKLFEDASKDVDFRVGLMQNISTTSQPASIIDTKKRLSEDSDSNGPKSKKTKSEKIDILFGTEDVDLRIPPPMSTITSSPISVPSVTTAAAATAASAVTIQVETKPQDTVEVIQNTSHTKLNDHTATNSNVNKTKNAKIVNRDIDLRLRPDLNDENSQESNDKFKMLLMQAQEQVDSHEVDQDQIQSMVQQIIKIKSDSDARKSFKRAATAAKSTKKDEFEEPIEAFSSGSEDETLKQSHRVPYKRRRPDSDKRSALPINSGAPPPMVNNNNSNLPKSPSSSSTIDTTTAPPPKERRPRKTKWSSPWEEPPKQPQPQPQPVLTMPPIPTSIIPPIPPFAPQPALNAPPDNVRQFSSSRSVGGPVWQPNVMPFNCSTVNPLAMINNAVPPMLGGAQIVMAQHGPSLGPCTAKDRTINIDGVPREIRFYGETAIAFMKPEGKEPKEIGFQSGERRVCVDNNESIVLAFNDSYKPFVINGTQHSIRFGTPTRELYIDNEWYECYFGDPAVGIVLNGKLHSVRIDMPAPQVRIGNLRIDLVVGKVDMYVDQHTKVSLFLDSQVQMFQINNQMHTIQFADYFLTAIIDNTAFPVKYGAMPVKFQLANSEHYIRFSVLPDNVVPGEIYVQNMKRTELQPNLVAPLPTPVTSNHTVGMPSISIPSLMSVMPNSDTSAAAAAQPGTSNQVNMAVTSESSNPPPAMDINDLFQKLLASGIINKPNNKDVSPNKEKEKDKLPVFDLSKPEMLKKRHPSVINAIYSGIQCSSCGIRFPLEQTIKYSQHLDWHFRENRRERDSARRAPARKLYLPLSEWSQYQEIENEDEREKSWFETQQTENDSANEDSNQRTASPPPSCVAGPNDINKTCDMCHDPFETFYNEETEEWHLRNAIRIEDNIYHPICYEDYKASLTLDESHMNASSLGDISTDDNAVDMQIKQEDGATSIALTNANERIPILDDDDDVIVLPQEEPVIQEIPDDDDHEAKETSTTSMENNNSNGKADLVSANSDLAVVASQDTGISTQPDNDNNKDDDIGKNNESDVQILEPQISILNLDEYEETDVSSNKLDNSELMPVVKIKEEPKYEGYEDDEDDGFEDVGTFEAIPAEILEDASVEDSAPLPPIQTQPILITSLDGNIEVQETQPPVTVGTNKIKINISKNVQLNKNSINSSESVDNNLAINNKESVDGQNAATTTTTKSVIENDTDRCENGSSDANAAAIDSNAGNAAAAGSNNESETIRETEIEYEVKESIKHVQFKRQPVFQSGLETSGLCSIM